MNRKFLNSLWFDLRLTGFFLIIILTLSCLGINFNLCILYIPNEEVNTITELILPYGKMLKLRFTPLIWHKAERIVLLNKIKLLDPFHRQNVESIAKLILAWKSVENLWWCKNVNINKDKEIWITRILLISLNKQNQVFGSFYTTLNIVNLPK